MTVAKPYLDFVDRLIGLHREFLDAGPSIAASVSKAAALQSSSDREKELDSVTRRLDEMVATLLEARIFHDSAGLLAFVLSDQAVVDAFQKWLAKHSAVMQVVVAGKLTAEPEQLRNLGQAASKALDEAVNLRLAIEAFIFSDRGWLRRGCYYMWSKARKAASHPPRRSAYT